MTMRLGLRVAPRLATLFLLLVTATVAQAGLIQIGTLGGDNCAPFGCNVGTYQQVYASSAFSGSITIIGVTFFNTVHDFDSSNELVAGDYMFSLSTTSKPVGGLETTFANNLGPDNTIFFSGALGGPLGGNSFTVSGGPFGYDPALGNLLLTVEITGGASGRNGTYFDENYGAAAPFSRMYPGADDYLFGNTGLVTAFQFQDEAIPEPSTVLLSGFGLLILLLPRRRKG